MVVYYIWNNNLLDPQIRLQLGTKQISAQLDFTAAGAGLNLAK